MGVSEIAVTAGGVLSLAMGAFHTRFHKIFGWEREFARVSGRNQRILYTVHLALLLLFFLFGLVSLAYRRELAACDGLAFGVCTLYAAFWLWRGLWQLAYFKLPKRGAGKIAALHYGLTLVFFLLFACYLVPILRLLAPLPSG